MYFIQLSKDTGMWGSKARAQKSMEQGCRVYADETMQQELSAADLLDEAEMVPQEMGSPASATTVE